MAIRQPQLSQKKPDLHLDSLTTRVAWAIAKSRGFQGQSPKSLTDKVNRYPEEVREKYKLSRIQGGKDARWLDLN